MGIGANDIHHNVGSVSMSAMLPQLCFISHNNRATRFRNSRIDHTAGKRLKLPGHTKSGSNFSGIDRIPVLSSFLLAYDVEHTGKSYQRSAFIEVQQQRFLTGYQLLKKDNLAGESANI